MGNGFTVTATLVVEEQVPAKIVIEKTVVCGTDVLFINAPGILLPLPLFAIPVILVVLVLVQLIADPATALISVILMVLIAAPEQIVWSEGAAFAEGV